MNPIEISEIREYVNDNIDSFHKTRLECISSDCVSVFL